MTARNFISAALAAVVVAIAAGSAAFAGLNLGGGGGKTAEAHDVYDRWITGCTLPRDTRVRINTGGGSRYVGENDGCTVTLPSIPVPQGATTVTAPAGTVVTFTEQCLTTFGDNRNNGEQDPLWNSITLVVAQATIRSVAIEHHHSSTATGVTGTGFYCGRHYRWSEFERDEDRPLFITAARRSLIGWVYVDSSGQQIASCNNHAPIFRRADQ